MDVGVNEQANARIGSLVRATYNSNVLVDSGLFAGVLRVPLEWMKGQAYLGMGLGFASSPYLDAATLAREVLRVAHCNSPETCQELAFLDYIASGSLNADSVATLVQEFCSCLMEAQNPMPLIGGETAEMPGVFKSGLHEVVGASAYITRDPGSALTTLDLGPALETLREPCLVFSADGVGTKASLAHDLGRLETVVEDLIHHSLGDILCLGARGLGIAIYVGGAELASVRSVLEAKVRSLTVSTGLTAFQLVFHEAPWLYEDQQVDLCAAVAGIADRSKLLRGATISQGDHLIGLRSSGLHTNGYSLARRALFDEGYAKANQWEDDLDSTLADALLAPHRNYATLLAPILDLEHNPIKGLAHITGGGIQGNLSRILPQGLGARVDLSSFSIPPVFTRIQKAGNIAFSDTTCRGMLETFNLGVGMILVVSPQDYESVLEALATTSEPGIPLGEIIESESKGVHERVHCVT